MPATLIQGDYFTITSRKVFQLQSPETEELCIFSSPKHCLDGVNMKLGTLEWKVPGNTHMIYSALCNCSSQKHPDWRLQSIFAIKIRTAINKGQFGGYVKITMNTVNEGKSKRKLPVSESYLQGCYEFILFPILLWPSWHYYWIYMYLFVFSSIANAKHHFRERTGLRRIFYFIIRAMPFTLTVEVVSAHLL